MRSWLSRNLAVVFLAICAACSGKNDSKNENSESATADKSALTANSENPGADSQVQARDLVKFVDLIVAQAADLPRADFDPAALASQLGKDPQAHFEWVRDQTWWAPYRGLLRGSKGVMLDRVGSNLDRAILLGDLLRHAGFSVRLAHAQLPEAQAKGVLGKVRPIPDQRRKPAASKPESPERQRELEAFIPEDEIPLKEQMADSKRRTEQAKALVRAQASQLYAAVKGAVTVDATADRRAVAALQDHWWVERKEGDKWIAMDVLMPDAKVGDVLAAATQTSDWKSDSQFPAITGSNWHSVQLRVVVERYADNAITEFTALETVLQPAEVLEYPITFGHMPKPWPETLPDSRTDPNGLGNAAVSVKEWVPFLKIGDKFVAQSGFTDSGDLIADPFNPNRDVAAVGGGGFMSGFGEALGGGETASSSITAEWIDYEIRIPGESSQRVRRPIFDLLGPAGRSANAAGFDASTNDRLIERYEALLSRTDVFLQPCDITEEFLAHLATKSIVANQAEFRNLAKEHDAAKATALATKILERIDSWGPLPNLAFWRSAISDRAGAAFIDRPNVLNYRIGRPAVNADRIQYKELIDVSANAIGVRRGTEMNAFEVRLRQGVADTVAEMLTLGDEPGKAGNTSSMFVIAGSGGNSAKLVGAMDKDAVRAFGWPDDTAARLVEDLDAGFMAFVLMEPVSLNERQRLGWWRVDPDSGETIGVMDTGFHAEEGEYSALLQHINALKNFLASQAGNIERARRLATLTPGQSLLLRAAVAAERALEAFAESRRPF